jgi:hypothetical protein
MKKIFLSFLTLLGIGIFFSCKNLLSKIAKKRNNPPIAGLDQIITLPTENVCCIQRPGWDDK